MEYIYILRQALVYIVMVFWIYNFGISLFSLIKFKDSPLKVNKKHKFMAILPAHNEEKVIANLIDSLNNQDYEQGYHRAVEKNAGNRRPC